MERNMLLLNVFLCVLNCVSFVDSVLPEGILLKTKNGEYNKLELPPSIGKDQLVQVNISLNLRNILDVNEISQLVTLESSLRMWWRDPRIRPDLKTDEEFISLNGEEIDGLWVPDLFVDQARKLRSPNVLIRPATLRVYEGGVVRFSARINYEVACNMDFHRFPLDQQVCEVKYESFGYSSKQLRFDWIPDKCQVNPNISLDQFVPQVIFQSSYDTDYYDMKYPGVILRIYLSRKLSFHVVQTYIPSALFVSAAFLSLLINPEAVPGRVAMVTMTMLTLMAMFGAVRQTTPNVSYVSLLDIWMVVCLAFIFMTLIEFSTVSYLLRKRKFALADRLEKLGLMYIPSMFVLFVIVYWLCVSFVK